jgi:uncharacterized protein (DUF697 family)
MAKSRKRKPSFDAPDAPGTDTSAGWVYRSDAAAPEPEPVTAPPPVEPAGGTAIAPRPLAAGMSEREKDARLLVDRYTKYAAAAGLVPVPVFDMAAIAGTQVAMVSALAALYGVPFSKERGRALVAAVLGGVMPTLAGHQILTMIAKRLTIVGTLFGMISVSGFAVAATYAVGRVFTAHFESGGTLLDIDVAKATQQVASHFKTAPQPS